MQRMPPAPPENYIDGQVEGRSMFSRVMMQAPTASRAFSHFVRAIFAELDLAPRDRELVTLCAIHLDGGTFEWAQHEHIAPNLLGIPVGMVEAIARDELDSPLFDARDQALLAFTRDVVRKVRVDDATYNALAAHFCDRHIVEILFTIGNYITLCRISEVLRIPPEPPTVGAAALNSALADVSRS